MVKKCGSLFCLSKLGENSIQSLDVYREAYRPFVN